MPALFQSKPSFVVRACLVAALTIVAALTSLAHAQGVAGQTPHHDGGGVSCRWQR